MDDGGMDGWMMDDRGMDGWMIEGFTFLHLADAFIQSDFQKRAFTKVHRSLIITTR